MSAPTLEELVFSAAQRALDQQSTALSDLRTRTSTLVAAATLSASFLGAAAIGHGAPAGAVVLAMAAFLLTGALAGWVLWRAQVSFAIDADRVQEELVPYREDPAAYLLRAARGLHDAYLENEKVIERRELVFGLALLALGGDPTLGVGAGASMTFVSDQPTSASKPASVRPDVGRMSLDVFMPENRLARKRGSAPAHRQALA